MKLNRGSQPFGAVARSKCCITCVLSAPQSHVCSQHHSHHVCSQHPSTLANSFHTAGDLRALSLVDIALREIPWKPLLS